MTSNINIIILAEIAKGKLNTIEDVQKRYLELTGIAISFDSARSYFR